MINPGKLIPSYVPFFNDLEIDGVHIKKLVLAVRVMEDFVAVGPKSPREVTYRHNDLRCPLCASVSCFLIPEILVLDS